MVQIHIVVVLVAAQPVMPYERLEIFAKLVETESIFLVVKIYQS